MDDENAIDWNLIPINIQIALYLPKTDLSNLSLTTKLIRKKLIPIIYKSVKINKKVLFNNPSYFMNKQILEFRNITYLSYLRLIGKNWFNNELAFKETRINPFVKEVNDQLKPRAIHCKSLSFENLLNSCYFLLPIAIEFKNLRTLTLNLCAISLEQLNNLLKKLIKLEVIELKNIDIVKSPDSNSISKILFPQRLRSLIYINNRSGLTNLPIKKPLQFLSTSYIVYNHSIYPLLHNHLPNLFKFSYIGNEVNEEFTNFSCTNNQIEDLSLPITFLLAIKTNAQLLKSLKKLRLYAQNFNYEQIIADNSNIPKFPNLEELNLNLRTKTEYEFAELLIKNCLKLKKLNVISIKFELEKLRELIKNAKNLKYFNDERLF